MTKIGHEREPQTSLSVPRIAERLLDTLGRSDFSSAVMDAVAIGARASGCAAFLFRPEGGQALMASDADHGLAAHRYARDYWRGDVTFHDGRVTVIGRDAKLYHYPTKAVRDPRLLRDCYETSDTVDQVLLRRRAGDAVIALSIFRRRGPGRFSADCVAGLANLAPMLLAAIGRHVALLPSPTSKARILSVKEAEQIVGALPAALTRREVQVCARVLRGLTSEGIAIDLGLSKATVATFRKRAYGRLGVSSAAELFNCCLSMSGRSF